MSRLSLAALALIGLAACTSGSPKQVATKTGTPATPAQVKPVARAAATRTRTPVARKPAHQTAVRPDTTGRDRNPLTNH